MNFLIFIIILIWHFQRREEIDTSSTRRQGNGVNLDEHRKGRLA